MNKRKLMSGAISIALAVATIIIAFLPACAADESPATPTGITFSEYQNDEGLIYLSNYAEITLSSGIYYTEFTINGTKVFDDSSRMQPKITELDNSILRFEVGDGTNNNKVHYINIITGDVSEEFLMLSAFSELSLYTDHYYVAFPTYDINGDSVFRVSEMFGSNYQDFSPKNQIEAFEYDRIIAFLNEREVYVEYSYFDHLGGKRLISKEIFQFDLT